MRARTLTLSVAFLSAATTLLVVVTPGLRFAYMSPRLHVAIDTVDAVIALLVAFLLFGRFGRTRRARDLLLVYALLVLGLGNLFLAAVPTALNAERADALTTWGLLLTRVIGAAFLVGATFSGSRKASARHNNSYVLMAAAVIVLLCGLFANSLEPPLRTDQTFGSIDPTQPNLDVGVMVLVLNAALVALFGIAAVRFTTIADRNDDALMRWFGAGTTLSSFARFNYLLYPSLDTDFVYTGDVYRLGFYLMLLIGAGREIASYWREHAETAVADERRRIARDLHDGLAQELSFLWGDLRALGREHPDDPRVARASAAAERALDESRRAIATFTRPPDEPLDVAITSFIYDVARRLDTRVRLDLMPDVEISGKLREDLLRVVREAVTNAARHGHAETIEVRLWRDEALRLEIADDGVGFDPDQPQRDGSFGIMSMRERVTNHGGTFEILSTAGEGTRVEVVLP